MMMDPGKDFKNLLTKIKVCHSVRVFGLDPNHKFVIIFDDVFEAFKILKKFNMKNKNDDIKETYYSFYT